MLYSAIRPLTTTFVNEPQPPQSACLQIHPCLPQVRPLLIQRIGHVLSAYFSSTLIPFRCQLAQSLAPAFALASNIAPSTCLEPKTAP